MFEEKISEAADVLARKQLGIEKQEDENRSDLPKMFVQISNVFQMELMEQLNKISANMMQKYDLTSVSVDTLGIIAEKIKEEAEDGKIQSISEISQSKGILFIAEHATIIQKGKELGNLNNESNQANIDFKREVELDFVKSELKKTTETIKKINLLYSQIDPNNVLDVLDEIKKIENSQEAQYEIQEENERLEFISKNASNEEKKEAKAILEADKIAKKEKSEKDANSIIGLTKAMFPIIERMDSSLYDKEANKDVWSSKILNIYRSYIDMNKEKIFELYQKFKSMSVEEIKEFVLDDLCKLNGIDINDDLQETPKEFLKNIIFNRSKKREIDIYSKNDIQNETKERQVSINYAKLFLKNTREFEEVKNLLQKINEPNYKFNDDDFKVLDIVKNIDDNFYHSMIRNVGLASERNNNLELKKKYNKLVEDEIKIQLSESEKHARIKDRLKASPEQQKDFKIGYSLILESFMKGTYYSRTPFNIQKKDLISYLYEEKGISEDERISFIEEIKKTKNVEEYRMLLGGTIEKIYNDSGIPFQQAEFLKNLHQIDLYENATTRANAKAKIVFDEGLYNNYNDFCEKLISGFENDEEYNIGLFDAINQKDPEIYNILLERINAVARTRKNKNLARIYSILKNNSRTDESFDEEYKEEYQQNNAKIKEVIDLKRETIKSNGQIGSTTQSSVNLFGLMAKIYDEERSDENSFKDLKQEVLDYISQDTKFSITETENLLKKVLDSSRNAELGKILANKIVELSEARGIEKNSLRPEQIIDLAQRKTQSKYLSENVNYDRASIITVRAYAKMFLEPNERNEVRKLVDAIGHPNFQKKYDFGILDRVKAIDESFYYSMIRSVGLMAKRTKNQELKDKYDELIASELMSKGYNNHDALGKNDLKAKIMFDDDIYCRYNNLVNSVKEGNTEGIYDEGMLEYLQKKVPQIYATLVPEMKRIAESRNDRGLLEVIERTKSDDMQNENNQVDINNMSKKSILTVQNLKVDEVVIAHSEGIDMFDQKNKNGQTVDDTGDGR